MKWSEKAWEASLPIYNKIIAHPFINELAEGTLSKQVFEFYIQQDAFYLAEYRKVLIGIASKLSDMEYSQAFMHFASDTMIVETELHESFLTLFKSPAFKEQSPHCLLYTSYLHSLMSTKPVYEVIAGVLPCFWVYKEVGDYILKKAGKEHNPYQSWINTYGGEAYEIAVNQAIDICNRIAGSCSIIQQQDMINAFTLSTKLEWMFWDGAYHIKKWEI